MFWVDRAQLCGFGFRVSHVVTLTCAYLKFAPGLGLLGPSDLCVLSRWLQDGCICDVQSTGAWAEGAGQGMGLRGHGGAIWHFRVEPQRLR